VGGMGKTVKQTQSDKMAKNEMERKAGFISALGIGTSIMVTFVMEQEEPYEWRRSRAVP